MKHFILTLFFLIATLNYNLTAQQISSETYNHDYLREDFNNPGENFQIITTPDNYFILDKGDYLLSRNNEKSEYAIIANNSSVSDFVLKTSIRIGPSNNKKASIGIILKAQQDGKGAIIFEINKQGEYRIKQLIGNTYQTLSGNTKQKGWVKSRRINGIDKHNFIEIRSENNIYDIYTNNEYLTTFFVPDFTSGSCGLIISPATKARISYYYINIKGEKTVIANYTDENTESISTSIEELKKKIKLLEENNAKLNALNNDTKGLQTEEMKKLHSNNANLKTIVSKQENKIISLNEVITDLNNQLTNTKKKNTNLATVSTEQEKEIKSLTSLLANNKKSNKDKNRLQEQISLEKAVNSELLNDLSNLNKSSKSKITQLNKKIKKLETNINTLTESNTTLTTNLASEKSSHQEAKNGLSESIKKKKAEIKTLRAKLDKANNELNTLKSTKSKHNDEITYLNTQISDLKNNIETLTTHINTANNKNIALKTEINELKELFILKDFEVNGVKPSEILKETSNLSSTTQTLKGNQTIYSVQLGVYLQEQPYSSINNIDNVWHNTTEHGTYIYYSGEFNSPQEAASHMNNLIAKGHKNTFVVTLTK